MASHRFSWFCVLILVVQVFANTNARIEQSVRKAHSLRSAAGSERHSQVLRDVEPEVLMVERVDPLSCAWDLAKLAGKLTPFGDWFKAAGTAINGFKLGAALVSGDGGAGTAGAGLGLAFGKEMLKAAVEAGFSHVFVGKAAAKTANPILKAGDWVSAANDIKKAVEDCLLDDGDTTSTEGYTSSSSAGTSTGSTRSSSGSGTTGSQTGSSSNNAGTTGCVPNPTSSSGSTGSGSGSGSSTGSTGSASDTGTSGTTYRGSSSSSARSRYVLEASSDMHIHRQQPCNSGSGTNTVSGSGTVSGGSGSGSGSGTVSGSGSGTVSGSGSGTNTVSGSGTNTYSSSATPTGTNTINTIPPGGRDPTTSLNTLQLINALLGVQQLFLPFIEFLIFFYGNESWIHGWTTIEELQLSIAWSEAFSTHVANSPGNYITIAGYNTLLNKPHFLSKPDIAKFLERYNNTLEYYAKGWYTPSAVPAGRSLNFLDKTVLDEFSKKISLTLQSYKARGMTEESSLNTFLQESFFKLADATQPIWHQEAATVDLVISQSSVSPATRRQFQMSIADSLDIKPYRVCFGQTVTVADRPGLVRQRIRILDIPGFPTGSEVTSWLMAAQVAASPGGQVPQNGFSLPPPDDGSSSAVTVFQVEEVAPEISFGYQLVFSVSLVAVAVSILLF